MSAVLQNTTVKTHSPNTVFWLFAITHCVLWTFLPTIVRHTLPLDAIEGTIWGSHWQLGYDKNPFMNAWLTHFAENLGGQSGWMIYFFSQLSVLLCFYSVWRLAKRILPPVSALMSVMCLEAIQYYNVAAIDFNDNVIEIGVWAFLIERFHFALTKNKTSTWITVGVLSAAAMMTKYYAVVLFAPMLFLFDYKNPKIYLAVFVFLILCLPHALWLSDNHWVTLNYAFDRVDGANTWWNHFYQPYDFAGSMIQACLLPILIVSVCCLGRTSSTITQYTPLTTFNKKFLLLMALGPFVVTLLLSAFAGMHLRQGWGTPLLSFWGVMLFAFLQPSQIHFKRFIITIFGLLLLASSAYVFVQTQPGERRSNFPGKVIAKDIQTSWEQQFHRPLKFIAGERWISGNIAFFSKPKAQVYMDWNPTYSPWIVEADLKRDGAVFVWDPKHDGNTLPASILARFPNIQKIEVREYPWMRNNQNKPVRIGIAVLAPNPSTVTSA